MPDFKLEVIIRNISQSDLEYVISQIRNAVDISGGKTEFTEKSLQIEFSDKWQNAEDENG